MNGPLAGRVRRAQPRDIDAISELWILISEHHAPLDRSFAMRSGAEAEVRELVRGILRDADAAVFVYDETGGTPGMCIVRVDRAPPILRERERAIFTDLCVRDTARRRGIGRALVGAALDWVAERGLDRVEVRVAAGNAEGQAFWRALGFADFIDVLHRKLGTR